MKFDRPKITLIDLGPYAGQTLKVAGYNITDGTFGGPYVKQGPRYSRIATTASLPSWLAESEVIVANLDRPEPQEPPQPFGNDYDLHWWAQPSCSLLDPRPVAMLESRGSIDRILRHGGIVVLFCAPKTTGEYVWGRNTGLGLSRERAPEALDDWSLLTVLRHVETTIDSGEEVSVTGSVPPLGDLLRKFSSALYFRCTVRPDVELQPFWSTLAVNKYGKTVAGMISPDKTKGLVVLLPQVRNQADFVRALFENVLPELAPHLFPHHAGGRWVHLPEYELPRVRDLQGKIVAVDEAARQKRLELEKEIEDERQRMAYLHQLLQETGNPLVRAVRSALETLGFVSIIDSDQQVPPGGRKREDLQIHDGSPTLLIEAKGIAGLPQEHEAIEVWKYLAPRMSEWKRTDVHGLSIINHQRHLPGLDRNSSPFSEDVLTNAREQQFGVMTGWDLYRLVTNFIRLSWRPEYVRPLFYRSGRIEPVPLHYEYVGLVEHFYPRPGALTVCVDGTGLRVGDRIAYEMPVDFIEQDVDSLQIDQCPVKEVTSSMLAGIKTSLTGDQARKGIRVFKVGTEPQIARADRLDRQPTGPVRQVLHSPAGSPRAFYERSTP